MTKGTASRLALILLAAAGLRAEIVDRIAVSVGTRVIAASDLDREIRVTAFLNGSKPDNSAALKRRTAERMVDQRLVRRELELSRYPAPSPADVEPLLEKIKSARFKSDAEFRQALASCGVTEKDLKDQLLWQLTFLRFIEVRFRPGIQVSSREVREYFETVVKPAALAARPGETPTLAQYRAQIENTLYGKRVDQEVEQWLKEARKRTAIEYHEEAFR